MEDFYQQLENVFIREAKRNPGSLANSQVIYEFMTSTVKKPVAPIPKVNAKTPGVTSKEIFTPISTPQTPVVSIIGNSLEELKSQVDHCQLCRLCSTRTKSVFGEGNPRAQLMFIGEGPGMDEDQAGRPFVGKAGQLLDKMITAMKFTREEVYICNIVKCRPPGNRVPEPDEVDKCLKYLTAQIKLIQPQVLVLLGATAVKFLLNTSNGITKMRGQWQSFQGIPCMPTFHPALLLRQPQSKREAWSDLKQVMAKFNKIP